MVGSGAAGPAEVAILAEESGYAASKAVGEVLVAAALERLLCRGLIIRLGMMVGDSATGACEPKDFVSRLLVGIAATRAFPETSPTHTFPNCLPVDVAAAAVVELAQNDAAVGVVCVANGSPAQSMASVRVSLLAFGSPFEQLPLLSFREWMVRVRLDAALSLWPLFSFASSLDEFPSYNKRLNPVDSCCKLLSPPTASALRRGFDEKALHQMLRFLFASRGKYRWRTVRRESASFTVGSVG